MSDRFKELSEQNEQEQIENELTNTLMDNTMMCKVMPKNTNIAKLIIETVMEKKVEVKSVKTQKRREAIREDFSDIVFDVYATDSEDGEFDIEFQKVTSTKELHNRLAYYGMNLYVGAGDKEKDYFPPKHRLAIIFLIAGHQSRRGPFLSEEKEEKRKGVVHHRPYGNDPDIYLVYLEEVSPDTDIGKLAHDLTCNRPEEIHHGEIADVVNSYQEDLRINGMALTKKQRDFAQHTKKQFFEGGKEEGIAVGRAEGLAEGLSKGKAEGLAEGLSQGRAEGLAEGLSKGMDKTKTEIAKNMIARNYDNASIQDITGLSESEIEELRKA